MTYAKYAIEVIGAMCILWGIPFVMLFAGYAMGVQ